MSEKIIPHLFFPGYVKLSKPGFKQYRAAFTHGPTAYYTNKQFRRASDALAYAWRLHARWIRLYEAAK